MRMSPFSKVGMSPSGRVGDMNGRGDFGDEFGGARTAGGDWAGREQGFAAGAGSGAAGALRSAGEIGGDGKTEFGRVAERLRIELITALTPQAKGRVERANQTLQDRLVREMRLRGISTIEEAQAFAPTFMARWNARFALAPRDGEDAHRPWKHGLDALDETLARREERTLSKALTFSVGGAVHCVKTSGPGIALRGAKVTLLHFLEGDMHVRYKNRSLSFTRVRSLPTPSPAEDEKTLDVRLDALLAAQKAEAQSDAPSISWS